MRCPTPAVKHLHRTYISNKTWMSNINIILYESQLLLVYYGQYTTNIWFYVTLALGHWKLIILRPFIQSLTMVILFWPWTQTHRHTEKHTHTDTERHRQWQTDRHTHTHTYTHTNTEKETQRDIDISTQRDADRERYTHRGRQGQRDRDRQIESCYSLHAIYVMMKC